MTRPLEQLPNGQWVHRPYWKRVVNAVLYWMQPGDKKPLLVASKFEGQKFLGYTLQRVEQR